MMVPVKHIKTPHARGVFSNQIIYKPGSVEVKTLLPVIYLVPPLPMESSGFFV